MQTMHQGLFIAYNYYACLRLRGNPSKPRPSKTTLDGSGTAALLVMRKLPIEDVSDAPPESAAEAAW